MAILLLGDQLSNNRGSVMRFAAVVSSLLLVVVSGCSHGIDTATAQAGSPSQRPPEKIVEKVVDETAVNELKATVAKLEKQLKVTEAKLAEAMAAIPPKENLEKLRKEIVDREWMYEMEDFVSIHIGASDHEVLIAAKKLQDKCQVVQKQLESVYRGEKTIVDDFTRDEIKFAHDWPLAYSLTIYEWQLHKNIPFNKRK